MLTAWMVICGILLAVGAGVAGDQTRNENQIQVLLRIERVTRIGEHIDISLSKIEEDEHCYFISPDGVNSSDNNNIDGVTVHERSEFVSCRITVGPIDRPLIGTWTLCGRHGVDVVHERCQSVNVSFHNNFNPIIAWQVTPHPQFNHSVSLGRYLQPVVISTGVTRSCHVITPNGEDLIITNDTTYPKIKLTSLAPATCSVSIGPIEHWMLGEWTLYGMFRGQFNTEVRLPLRMDLFDEDNPFAQPYNLTVLDPIDRFVSLGRNITVEVTGRGNIDACEYRSPSGDRYQFNDTNHFPGVTILDVGILIICRMSIGPIDESMLGEWQIMGKFSSNGIFTARRQPLIIETGDEDKEKNVVWLPHIERITITGHFIDITLNNIANNETCYFENPLGERGEKDMNGVRVQASSTYVSCRITVGPMEQSLIGNWTLCGKHGYNNRYKRCQSVNIAWHNNINTSITWSINQQRDFTHSVSINRYLHPVVNNSASTSILSCHLITPNGEDLVLNTESQYPRIQLHEASGAVCAVSIGPIERWMLGEWTLYGIFGGRFIVEVRLPMNLELYDEDNPFVQPYNVTNLNTINHIIQLETIVTVNVNGTGNIDSCRYRAPTGQLFDFNASEHFPGVTIIYVSNAIVCRFSIGPIQKQMLGEWQIVGQFSNNGIFTEWRQTFFLIQEDPENPIIEDRTIQNLTDRHIDTAIGRDESVTIVRERFVVPETCHIRTPAGRQYIMSESFNVFQVTPVIGFNIECGVSITVGSEDMIGEWTLIARGLSGTEPVERRQRFFIHVEEQVEAFRRDLVVTKGNDLHIRLRNPTIQYDTCILLGPDGNQVSNPITDTNHIETCGFIVKSIGLSDQGTWDIVYGRTIVYRAPVHVTVIDRGVPGIDHVDLVKDIAANQALGPDNAVYCRLEDPAGFVVFDGFGKCRLVLERVTMEHDGLWRMILGLNGSVLVKEHNFVVNVREAEPQTEVTTTVQIQWSTLTLTCLVSSDASVRACKFRDPRGGMLIATQGVGQDRYVADKVEHSYISNGSRHECIIRINNPTVNDLGLWRCSIETDVGIHFGFLSVICPWLMKDPEIQASVLSEPILTANRQSISTIEGERVTMSCSIQSAITYCYFRASNGTIFSVTPEISSSYLEYVGDGFHSGDCGVRFNGLMATDSGNWTCHVGLVNETQPEQRARFHLTVQEPITVRHYWHRQHRLLVEAQVHSQRRLRYCRFVRSDGLGFTPDNMPAGYRYIGSLDNGHCLLQIEEATIENMRPWTIAVKIVGQGVELSRQTTDDLHHQSESFFPLYLWFVIILSSVFIMTLVLSLGPKKNRKWTYDKASRIRNSIRNSMRKSKTVKT